MAEQYIYILGDGNKVRERIEYYLLNGDLESLRVLSQALLDAVDDVRNVAEATMKADVIMAGGDDILLVVRRNRYRREYVEQLC